MKRLFRIVCLTLFSLFTAAEVVALCNYDVLGRRVSITDNLSPFPQTDARYYIYDSDQVIADIRANGQVLDVGTVAVAAVKASASGPKVPPAPRIAPHVKPTPKPPCQTSDPLVPNSTSSTPSFIVTPNGEVIIVPKGAIGPTPTRASGFIYTNGSGGHGLHPNVTGVRIMDANWNQGPRTVYMNSFGEGQTVNPVTGRTVAPSDPAAHHYLTPW